MATYTFTVELQGDGDTEEEAWEDATSAFSDDPGTWKTCEKEDDYEDILKIPPVIDNTSATGKNLVAVLNLLDAEAAKFVEEFLREHPRRFHQPLDALFLWEDTPPDGASGFLSGMSKEKKHEYWKNLFNRLAEMP